MVASIEGTIERPGYSLPWVFVVQPADEGQGFVWGVYSQSSTKPRWRGYETTEDAALQAALGAPDCQHSDSEPVYAVDGHLGVQVHHYACTSCSATVPPQRPDTRQPPVEVVRLRHEPPGGVL